MGEAMAELLLDVFDNVLILADNNIGPQGRRPIVFRNDHYNISYSDIVLIVEIQHSNRPVCVFNLWKKDITKRYTFYCMKHRWLNIVATQSYSLNFLELIEFLKTK